MSQMKDSESAKLNAIKRNLTITLKVLENELDVFKETLGSNNNDIKFNEHSIRDVYLRDSIKSVCTYLKDLREDCSDTINQEYQDYLIQQRSYSDWVYEHYDNNLLYSRLYDETIEYLNDSLDYKGFRNINFNEFEFVQGILYTIKYKGILWKDEIDYLINNNFIEAKD